MSANLRGITFMISAMAMFTLSDLFLKLAARSYSAPEIMLVMGLIGGALFGTLARINALPLFGAAFFAPTVMLRNASELIGTFCIITALTLAPLSLVTSITQATPLVVTAGAALILRERVGLRRWLAVHWVLVLRRILPNLNNCQHGLRLRWANRQPRARKRHGAQAA